MPPQHKHYRFVRLYLYGPEGIRGDWEVAAREAGFRKVPRRNNPVLLKLLEAEEAKQRYSLVLDGTRPADDDAEGWRILAEKVKPILRDAALGIISIDPQQRMAIKEIIDRAEGKAGQPQRQEAVGPYVVVLPTLGTGKNQAVCEECLKRLQEDANKELPTGSPERTEAEDSAES